MNTHRISQWSWSARQLRCLILCAACLTGSALGDELAISAAPSAVRVDMPRAKARKSSAAAGTTRPVLSLAWGGTDLVPEPWRRPDMTVLRRPADLLTDGDNLVASSLDASNLFRTGNDLKYRDTLRLLLTKRQLRIWLRDDLHLQCEVKRYRSLDQGRELGLKLGLYYRFN